MGGTEKIMFFSKLLCLNLWINLHILSISNLQYVFVFKFLKNVWSCATHRIYYSY